MGPYPYIFIDFPFGYLNIDLAPFIDCVCYVKTPLDVALSRQILRDYTQKESQPILKWLKTYLSFARPIMLDHEQAVSRDADIILDGMLPVENQVSILIDYIKKT